MAKLSQDWFPLLELLAMATNPHCKFHIYNGTRPSETVPAGAQLADDELFARPPDPRSPKVKDLLKNYHLIFSHNFLFNGFCGVGFLTFIKSKQELLFFFDHIVRTRPTKQCFLPLEIIHNVLHLCSQTPLNSS